MVAYKNFFYNVKQQIGASMLEVMLAMAIVASVAPFLYTQLADSNDFIRNMSVAKNIIDIKDPMFNFIRVNQDLWPDTAQIKLSEEELDSISDIPVAAFIDKYLVQGATVIDTYLAFDFGDSDFTAAQIANSIGIDAAVVGQDGIAYGQGWAVSAPDFKEGFLIYRITRDLSGEDKTRYLHRGTTGEDELNKMLRNLNMGSNNIYNIGGITAKSLKSTNGSAFFVESGMLNANTVYFSSGANIDGEAVYFDRMRVTDDVSGFRNIYADSLNGNKFTTKGRIISDRVNVLNSVNVSNNLTIKSDSLRTVSGFVGIKANSVYTPFLTTEEIIFYDDFGLTVSGELLYSTETPIKIGSWYFPSTRLPQFSDLHIERATIPSAPSVDAFKALMTTGWQTIPAKTNQL